MSDAHDGTQTNLSLNKFHVQASDWIERRDFGNWTDDDSAQLETWLSASVAHRIAFLRAEANWKRTEMLAALRPFRPDPTPPSPPPRARMLVSKIVASFFVLAVLGTIGARYFRTPHYLEYSTPVGGHKTIALADGSSIELNTDTAIRVAQSSSGRQVFLDRGEAYFQVKHDAAHPLVVTAGSHRITDLGTEFLVRKNSDSLEIALVEGRARLEGESSDDKISPLTLMPGDIVMATANSLSLTKKPPSGLANSFGWRRGVLVFDHTSLAQAAIEINRYNQKKLIVADSSAGRVKLGGTFRVNDVQEIANAAREVFGLHVEDRGDEIVISR